jgi:hypothetical protein
MIRIKDPKPSLHFYQEVRVIGFCYLHLYVNLVSQILGMELLTGRTAVYHRETAF